MNTAKKLAFPVAVDSRPDGLAGAATSGRVVAVVAAESYRVRVAGGSAQAARAPSCLLVPEVGDEVWLLPAEGALVIAAVLRRATEGPARVELPGSKSELSASELSLRSDRALELESREAVRVRGPALEVATGHTRIASHAVELFASRLTAGLGTARLAAEKIDAKLDSLVMRLKRSLRWVDEVEQVRAGQLDLRASGPARLHGDSALLSAEGLAQVRGEEVHLA